MLVLFEYVINWSRNPVIKKVGPGADDEDDGGVVVGVWAIASVAINPTKAFRARARTRRVLKPPPDDRVPVSLEQLPMKTTLRDDRTATGTTTVVTAYYTRTESVIAKNGACALIACRAAGRCAARS